MVFDGTTTDPMQQAVRDSLIAFMAAMAQSQAEVTKEAQKAGITHARANDDGTKYRGRKPTFTCEQFARARELLNQGSWHFRGRQECGFETTVGVPNPLGAGKANDSAPGWYPEEFPQKFRSNPCCSVTSSAS